MPFDEYKGAPSSMNHLNPQELLAYLKRDKYPDAQMMPFMKYFAAQGDPVSDEQKLFYVPFTDADAFLIYTKSGGVEIGVLSKVLCKKIGGFQEQ